MNDPGGSALSCARIAGDGLLISVRLTPRSSRDKITGLESSTGGTAHISARVRAVPEKGAANTALVKLVSKWLGVPKSTVSVRTGSTSRLKTLHVQGDPEALLREFSARLRAAGGR